jgi:transposase
LLAVVVHSAGIQDRVSARAVLIRLFTLFSTIRILLVDSGYTGKLIDWARTMFAWRLEVVKRSDAHRFTVLPKRWIVERTFAWLNQLRRLSKDYEVRPDTAETMVKIAMTHLLVRRLARI